MALILDGTNGLSDVDGSASTPAIRGTDANTGIFFPAADTIGFAEGGAEAMRIDSSGNVGIGTTNPSYKLHVIGQGFATTGFATTVDGSAFTPSGLSPIPNYGIGAPGSNFLSVSGFAGIQFYSNQLERMRIDQSGNVGIGTSSLTTRFAVNGGTSTSQIRWNVSNATYVEEVSTNAAVSAYVYKSNDASYHIWKLSSSEAMRIDSSGNVGIGTSSPDGKLDIATGGSTDIVAALGGTFPAYTYRNGSGAWFHAGKHPSSDYFYIGNGATPTSNINMVVDSSGNVGIGTSSPLQRFTAVNTSITGGGPATSGSAADPNAFTRFQGGTVVMDFGVYPAGSTWIQSRSVANYATNYDLILNPNGGNLLVGTTSSLNGALLTVQNSGGSGMAVGYGTTAGQWRRMYMNTSNQGLYFYNGNNEGYLSSAGSWTNASDARLKKNIRDIEYGLSTILSTQPRHFERNDVDGTYIGFIAQELQTIIPEVVSGDPEKQLGVDYGSLVAVAFKAIQELKAEVDSLKAQLNK